MDVERHRSPRGGRGGGPAVYRGGSVGLTGAERLEDGPSGRHFSAHTGGPPTGCRARTRPSWVRLRHSTIGTTSPYAPAAESPVSQCRGCSGLSHQACRAAPASSLSTGEREVAVVGAGVAEDQQRRLRAERVGVLLGELGERAAVVGAPPQRGVRGARGEVGHHVDDVGARA